MNCNVTKIKPTTIKSTLGKVAIAENQTAFTPVWHPGGWQILAAPPLMLIDGAEKPRLIAMGDSVRFRVNSRDEFLVQGGQARWLLK